MAELKKVALMYDFDYTLSPAFMQNFMLKEFKVDIESFWKECNDFGVKHNMDSVLAYMYKIIEFCKKENIKLTEKWLNNIGKKITLYEGVEGWFNRITEFGKTIGLDVEHYIISSGNKEILDGTSIAKYFKRIYASSYAYDDDGIAFWPTQVVNFTTKTQYIFRIKKNILDDLNEQKKINQKMKPYVNYDHMLYFGDGFTDIPSMKVIKDKGGYSICVYDEKNLKAKETAEQILKDKRVNYIAPTNYTQNSQIDNLVKDILKEIVIKDKLKSYKE